MGLLSAAGGLPLQSLMGCMWQTGMGHLRQSATACRCGAQVLTLSCNQGTGCTVGRQQSCWGCVSDNNLPCWKAAVVLALAFRALQEGLQRETLRSRSRARAAAPDHWPSLARRSWTLDGMQATLSSVLTL